MFNERLKSIREFIGLNQVSFAELFEVSQRTLSNWETGRNEPSLNVLQKLHLDYNVNLNWLLTGQGQMILDSSDNVDVPEYISILIKKSYELSPDGFTQNLIKFIFEYSVRPKLKNYDKSMPFLKYLFYARFDTLANFRLMMRVFKNLDQNHLQKINPSEAKKILINLVENYEIGLIESIRFSLTQQDKKNTLVWLEETFSDLDCYAILMDIDSINKSFDEVINWLSFKLPILKIKGEEV